MAGSDTGNVANWVIIPAAGVGARMQTRMPKQYLPLADSTILEQTLDVFAGHDRVTEILLVLSPEDSYWEDLGYRSGSVPLSRVDGGDERCFSVLNGLRALEGRAAANDWVLVHDAARPCLRHDDLDKLQDAVAGSDVGGLLGTPVHDTMKRVNGDGYVEETIDRSTLWHALTPQMFRYGVLRSALEVAIDNQLLVTDEASAIEQAGLQPVMVEGSRDNIKITRPEDLRLAEFYIRLRG